MPQRLAAEFAGTAFLLMVVVGSGVMAERLAGGNMAITLLANSIATGAGLAVLIAALAPVSGAHFNPLVSMMFAARKEIPFADAAAYCAAQLAGALLGVALANAMFGLPPWSLSSHMRSGAPLILGESVATFGLLGLILLMHRRSADAVGAAVGAYIAAAYWFTSSTSFANPAVTLARALTDTFTGIRPADVPGFLLGQLAGAVLALAAAALFQVKERPSTRNISA